jgi:hypothetical protein
VSRLEASLVALGQVGVLAVNAIARQLVQNAELRQNLDLAAQPVTPQWGPMIVFLLLFVAGVAVIGWMIAQVIKAQSIQVVEAPVVQEAPS